MLETLSIQGIVLIEKLELHFSEGFTVLTGETGAGKSILLDAFGLALGERANIQFINPRHTKATVSATFRIVQDHPVRNILQEQSLSTDDILILRRTLYSDGKSRAYVNDQVVSLGLLKTIGDQLVEIHGQFDHLLDAKSHLAALDRFAELDAMKQTVSDKYQALKTARQTLTIAIERNHQIQKTDDFLNYAIQELTDLNPQIKEEENLRNQRSLLMNYTKIIDHLKNIFQKLYDERGVEILLQESLRSAQKLHDLAENKFNEISSGLELAVTEIEEIRSSLVQTLEQGGCDENELNVVEERLFKLRTVARKHTVTVDELPDLLIKMQKDQDQHKMGENHLEQLQKNVEQAQITFLEHAQILSQHRHQGALSLQDAIKQELNPLKLEKSRVCVDVQPIQEQAWNENGIDSVEFTIQPNPGMPMGPLIKIASGGERSRFMLALKGILARNPYRALLIFDEIDAGMGGAVSAAVGERMARLGSQLQVLAITHAPQVAACADKHWVVSKQQQGAHTVTDIVCLSNDGQERQEEIARMLAGEQITLEARAAAAQLLSSLRPQT